MKKYAVLTEEMNGTLNVLKVKKMRNAESISFRRGTYPIDPSRPHHQRGRKTYYFIDVRNGQLTTNGLPTSVSAELIDEILTRQVARQLAGGLGMAMSGTYIPILIGVCIGLPIGIIAGGYI